jgi:uncharacterized protein with PhoU and TrkA domain
VSQALLDVLAAGTTELYRLEPGSPAAGRTLRELDLRHRTGATVIAVVRDGTPVPNPDVELRLEEGDTLVLVGSHQEIERAFGRARPAGRARARGRGAAVRRRRAPAWRPARAREASRRRRRFPRRAD